MWRGPFGCSGNYKSDRMRREEKIQSENLQLHLRPELRGARLPLRAALHLLRLR